MTDSSQTALRRKREAFFRGYARLRGIRGEKKARWDAKLARDSGLSADYLRRVRCGRDHLSEAAVARLRENITEEHEAALDPSCLLRDSGSQPRSSARPIAEPTERSQSGSRNRSGRTAHPQNDGGLGITIIGTANVPGGGSICTLLLPAGMRLVKVEKLEGAFVLCTEPQS